MNNNTEFSNKKTNKKIPELLIVIICSVILIYLSLVSLFPLISLFGIVLFSAFACLYSMLLNYGKKASVLTVLVVGFVATSVSAINTEFNLNALIQYANLVFPIACATVLMVCESKKASRSVSFASLTVSLCIYICTFLIMLVYSVYRKCDIATISIAIEEMAELIGDSYRNAVSTLSSELPEGTVDTSLVRNLAQTMELSFKMSLPSALVIYSMAISALCLVFYKPLTIFSGNKEKCIDGRIWRFELTRTSAVFFEIIFTAYILVTLFGSNITLLSALINLISVLMVPFAYIGIRSIYNFFKIRNGKKLTGILVVLSAFLILTAISGTSTFFMLAALIGASATLNKGRFTYIKK